MRIVRTAQASRIDIGGRVLTPSAIDGVPLLREQEVLLVRSWASQRLCLAVDVLHPLRRWPFAQRAEAESTALAVARLLGRRLTRLQSGAWSARWLAAYDARVLRARQLRSGIDLSGVRPERPHTVTSSLDGLRWSRPSGDVVLGGSVVRNPEQSWRYEDIVAVVVVVFGWGHGGQQLAGVRIIDVEGRWSLVEEPIPPRTYSKQRTHRLAQLVWLADQVRRGIERCSVPVVPTERESAAIESLQGLRQRAIPTAGA